MSDYISREDALRELCATKCGRNFSDCNSTGPCIYGRIISKLPSADVVSKEDLGKHLSEIYAEIARNNTDYSCGFRYGYKSAIDDVARYERW